MYTIGFQFQDRPAHGRTFQEMPLQLDYFGVVTMHGRDLRMAASSNLKVRSCWLLLFFLLFCTQGSAQDANCSAATEQPVFSGVDPPAGTTTPQDTSIYTIFGGQLNQVVQL